MRWYSFEGKGFTIVFLNSRGPGKQGGNKEGWNVCCLVFVFFAFCFFTLFTVFLREPVLILFFLCLKKNFFRSTLQPGLSFFTGFPFDLLLRAFFYYVTYLL